MNLSEISASESAEFQKNGVVVLRDVLSQDWLDRLAEAIEANMATVPDLTVKTMPRRAEPILATTSIGSVFRTSSTFPKKVRWDRSRVS